ncbi:MAG: hypothetical protein DHS20C12_06700 [Pseudohongiella sp.]|nr:MAG: hypothetical protein DHS20C12_06700 [Pseudohongiella sp.]
MNSKLVSDWLTIISNLGVLIGLIFLIVEINQNSRIASATAQLELAQDRREIYQYADSMIEIESRFRRDEEVTDSEAVIAARFYESRIRSYETQWHFWRNGLVDDDQFEASQELLEGTINTPIIMQLWNDTKDRYHPEFVRLVDERLK